MLDEAAISLLLKEHAYSKKRRIYSKEDLESQTTHLFNECEYTVCTFLNSNPQPSNLIMNQSNGANQLTNDINIKDVGCQYEGFVHFKKTYYTEKYRGLVAFNDKTPSFEPSQPDRSHWQSDQNEVYDKIETIINEFFHGSVIVLQEKNTVEYKMRKYRLLAESHCYDLADLLEIIYHNFPSVIDWLNEKIMNYYTDYQIRSYVELLTMILPNNAHLANLIKFEPDAEWFDGVYWRKVFDSTIDDLYNQLADLWIPIVDTDPPSKTIFNAGECKPKLEPESRSESVTSASTNDDATHEYECIDQDIALLIIPPLPCFVLEDTDSSALPSDSSTSSFAQCERMSIFEKYFKNSNILDYKIKPLHQKDFNDEMIQWWINDLGCVIQRRIIQFRKTEPLSQLYVVGWLTGASLAYKIFLSLLEHINGVVLINMPTNNGIVGADKTLDTRLLYRSNHPIIFVASSESELSNLSELREIRASMSHQTSLIYAHFCDDFLMMKCQTKKRLILTQDIVDYAIVDSVREQILQEINIANVAAAPKITTTCKKSQSHTTTSANQKNSSGHSRKSQADTAAANKQASFPVTPTTPTPTTPTNSNSFQVANAISQLKPSSLSHSNPAMSFILANSARKLTNINPATAIASTCINNPVNFENLSLLSTNKIVDHDNFSSNQKSTLEDHTSKS